MVYTSISKLDCAKFCNDTNTETANLRGASNFTPSCFSISYWINFTFPATTPPLFLGNSTFPDKPEHSTKFQQLA
jgi:hypothetical protein